MQTDFSDMKEYCLVVILLLHFYLFLNINLFLVWSSQTFFINQNISDDLAKSTFDLVTMQNLKVCDYIKSSFSLVFPLNLKVGDYAKSIFSFVIAKLSKSITPLNPLVVWSLKSF